MIYCNGNNIIQSGDTLRFWAFVTDVNGGYLSNQDVVFYTVKDGVKTQIGSPVVTDSNGIAVCDYVGRGMGDICIMAETEIDGTFVSETYKVEDCIILDSMLTDTTANYYVKENVGTSLEFTENGFKLTGGTSERYFTMGTSNGVTSNLARFKGKKLCLKADIVSITGRARMFMMEYESGSVNQQATGDYSSTTGTISATLSNEISQTLTRMYFRVQVENENDVVVVNNFRVYPV